MMIDFARGCGKSYQCRFDDLFNLLGTSTINFLPLICAFDNV